MLDECRLRLLSELTAEQLGRAARDRGTPKWSSLCMLRLLQLPTLDGMLITPGLSGAAVATAARSFAKRVRSTTVMVRTDGGSERTQYVRGGNTLSLRRAVAFAMGQLALSRSIILLEPTNRFTNQIAFNCLLTRDGSFTIECLGAGFDASDLNRGGLRPEWTIEGAFASLLEWEEVRPWDLSMTPDTGSTPEERRALRLANIGRYILPSMGVRVEGDPASFASRWLRRKGLVDLWNEERCRPSWAHLVAWTAALFSVGNWMIREVPEWSVLVLSGAVIEGRKLVYWDVVEGSSKWAVSGKGVRT